MAERAASYEKSVALIDPNPLGGTCVNLGCVPKKIMWYGAHLAHAVKDAPGFGIQVGSGDVDWTRLVEGRQRYVEGINDYWRDYVTGLGIAHIQGRARFVDAHSVVVDGTEYNADHIVIATGGRPIIPALPGAELGIDSDGFFDLKTLPGRVAVIGTGYIGVELAGMLRALGSKVSMVARRGQVLRGFDELIGTTIAAQLHQQGIALHRKFQVAGLKRNAHGISLIAESGDSLDGFDSVIWAVGRRPNTQSLDLPAAGVKSVARWRGTYG